MEVQLTFNQTKIRLTLVVWLGLYGASGCAASAGPRSGASASRRMGGGNERGAGEDERWGKTDEL
jgi:hypothetical protein